jgi:hypothetical protein
MAFKMNNAPFGGKRKAKKARKAYYEKKAAEGEEAYRQAKAFFEADTELMQKLKN